ncbi:hypothetical protein SAMN06265360_1195 [Haloechinothrix alba]|uniref:Uncharacterized protein n=1 Tax=Haloechinothrix alba TaxID=664784 RepID=A0A238Z4V0_9PSEU|nr:hypothetical protein SAMN06265360_1195 [Haloechinothrix alba]
MPWKITHGRPNHVRGIHHAAAPGPQVYPRSGQSWKRGRCRADRSPAVLCQLHQFPVLLGPEVLVAVGQQDHPFRVERVDGSGVVRDKHDRARVAA